MFINISNLTKLSKAGNKSFTTVLKGIRCEGLSITRTLGRPAHIVNYRYDKADSIVNRLRTWYSKLSKADKSVLSIIKRQYDTLGMV